MNSYRRGLRIGVLVNPKLFVLENVNLAPPTIGWSTWSNLVKLVKNLYYLVRVITNDMCKKAFQELKRRLTSAPILIVPEREQRYTVYCDASKAGLGCILMQSERVVAYGSCYLKNHGQNYPTHDMELAAIVLALMIWRHYLYSKRGKMLPRYIGSFEILKMVGTIAYRLALPSGLSGVHEVFHVSILQKYTPDPTHVVDWRELTVDANGTFEEGPVRILDS